MKYILIVEDDKELAQLTQEYLTSFGYATKVVEDGLSAVTEIETNPPDLLLLDVMLPGMSGFSVCRAIRDSYHGPILMMTANQDELDQVYGLDIGADDYVIKPVRPRLLLARVQALLRRADELNAVSAPVEPTEQTVEPEAMRNKVIDEMIVNVGALRINKRTRETLVNNTSVTLTSGEFDLLCLLADKAGEILTRDFLYEELQGFPYNGFDRAIDVRVAKLRSRLEVGPEHPVIKTIRGKGYMLAKQV